MRQLSPLPPAVPDPAVRSVVLLFLLSAATLAASLPLAWHKEVVRVGYRLIRGIDGASWLTIAAALCVGFAVFFMRRPPGFLSKWLVILFTFLVWVGMWVDYIDWQGRAAANGIPAYFGPGFYVALGGACALLVTTVHAWRSSSL